MSSDGIRSPPVTPSPLDPLPTQSTPPNVVRSPTATSCSCGSAMVRTDRIGSSPVRCHTGCVRSADPTHCAGRKRRGLGSCSSVLSAPSPPPWRRTSIIPPQCPPLEARRARHRLLGTSVWRSGTRASPRACASRPSEQARPLSRRTHCSTPAVPDAARHGTMRPGSDCMDSYTLLL